MEENTTTPAGLSWYKDPMFMAGVDYSMAGFAQLASGYLSYGANKTNATGYGVQAESLEVNAASVELQAQEAGNLLRKKFLAMVGNATYSAAARGVSVDSGSVRANLERSSEEMGKDVATINRNAAMKAKSLRSDAAVARGYAKAYKKAAPWQLAAGLMGGIGNVGIGGSLMFGKEK